MYFCAANKNCLDMMQNLKSEIRYTKLIALTLFAFLHFACQEKADLIIHNATIHTFEKNQPKANSIVIKDGIIQDIGNDLIERYEAKSVVDAKSLAVYPGFIDAHSHFLGYGLRLNQLDLKGTQSIEEIITRAQEFKASQNLSYIVGFGWDQNNWEDKSFPHKAALDEHFSDIPVFLFRIDGHALWVNQKALEIAGVDTKTTVAGGVLMQDKAGLTGFLSPEKGLKNQILLMPNFLTLLKKEKNIATVAMFFNLCSRVVFLKDLKEMNSMFTEPCVQLIRLPIYSFLIMAISKSLVAPPKRNSLCKMERQKFIPLQEHLNAPETTQKILRPQKHWPRTLRKTVSM